MIIYKMNLVDIKKILKNRLIRVCWVLKVDGEVGDQVIFYKCLKIFIKNNKSNKCQKIKQNLKSSLVSY